jgi:sigma-E factor negative regulatory protein RseA
MNDQEPVSQLSALFDRELPPEQAEWVIRRALKDPQLRSTYGRYALISAALRGEPLALVNAQGDDLADAVHTQLSVDHAIDGSSSETAPIATPLPGMGAAQWFKRGAWGAGIAASVAVATLMMLREPMPSVSAPNLSASVALPAAPTPASPASTAPVAEPVIESLPSYTTPVSSGANAARASQALVNYVVAHSEIAASAVRFSPLSTVMSAEEDLTQDAIEMTEAEIGAHR